MQSDNGSSVLIHAGIDTVDLKGDGFDVKVRTGMHVNQGDLILVEDVARIRSKGLSSMVVLVNLDQ